MSDVRFGLRVSAVIFAIITVGHLIRVAVQLELRIAEQPIPMWPSILAAVIFGFLGVWMWRLSNRSGPP